MAYFEDGSACTYFRSGRLPPLVAIGWLGRGHPFQTGDADPEVLRRLVEFQYGAWSGWQPVLYLGHHGCDFCVESSKHAPNGPTCMNLFIPGNRVTYAAPEGIVHYIHVHRYLPPADFCTALVASPPVNSPEYFARLRENGWPEDVGSPLRRRRPEAGPGVIRRILKRWLGQTQS
jgi:hypothetical protein